MLCVFCVFAQEYDNYYYYKTQTSDTTTADEVEHYNAKGDGVTDDTAAISLAITSNRTVHFPAGTYLISSQIVKTSLANVVLSGEGKDVSIIKCSASATFTNSALAFVTSSYIEIKDLTFDQNNNTSFGQI